MHQIKRWMVTKEAYTYLRVNLPALSSTPRRESLSVGNPAVEDTRKCATSHLSGGTSDLDEIYEQEVIRE